MDTGNIMENQLQDHYDRFEEEEKALIELTERIGERISQWIDKSLTYENRCKRDLEEGDGFSPDEVSWMFTQKGQRLYESYVRRGQKLIEKKFPNHEYDDLERHTGVIYP